MLTSVPVFSHLFPHIILSAVRWGFVDKDARE